MAFTKIVPAGINTGGSFTLQELNIVGVLTAASISGPLSGDATGLAGTPDITVGVVTAASATISGDLTVNGTTTTLDTVLTEVDKLEVGANNTTVGVAITQSGTGDILRLYDGATQVVAVKNGGNVGIGTDTPLHLLELNHPTQPRLGFSVGGTDQYRIQSVSGGNYIDSLNSFLIFRGGASGTTNLAILTNAGNLGIGTITPTEKLDVRGDLVVAESIAVNRPRIILSAPDDGTNYRHLFGANLQVDSSGTFTTPTANISGGGWEYLPANNLNNHGDIRYISAPDTNSTPSTPVERFRITSSGNVGIGTDNPTDKLHVYRSDANTISTIDSVSGDAGLQLRNSGDGNWSGINFIRERSTGTNVTGGSIWMPSVTANNSALLYIQTQSASANAGADGALVDNNGVRLKLASQPNGVAADTAFSVEVGSQERLRISSTGLVGIGTDNPDHILTVHYGNGSAFGGILVQNALYSSNLDRPYLIAGTRNYDGTTSNWGTFGFQHRIKSNSGGTGRVTIDTVNGEAFCVDNSGDVGIGTDNPIMRLHVHGAANSAESRIRLSSAEGSGLTIRAQSATENNINVDSGEDLTISEGNVERIRVGAGGSVGIGLTDPAQLLHLRNNLGPVIRFENIDDNIVGNESFGALEFESNDASSGCAGVLGKIECFAPNTLDGTATNGGAIRFFTSRTNPISLDECVRITPAGYLKATSNSFLNATANFHEFTSGSSGNYLTYFDHTSSTNPYGLRIQFSNDAPDNNTNTFIFCSDNTATRFRVYSDGDAWTSDAGTLTSDITLKRDITDVTPKLQDVMRLRVRNFYWNEDYHPNKQDKKLVGFVAQEFEEVFPGLVSEHSIKGGEPIYDEDGNETGEKTPEVFKKGIKEAKLVPILVKALQEAVERIETLEAEVAALKAQ